MTTYNQTTSSVQAIHTKWNYPTLSKELPITQEEINNFMDEIKEGFEYLRKHSDEIQITLSETKESLESDYFRSEEDKALMLETSKDMIRVSNTLALYAQAIKSSEVLSFLEKLFSPELANKLEKLSEDIEDIAENIEIGIKFDNELSKLEPLLREYSKIADEVD